MVGLRDKKNILSRKMSYLDTKSKIRPKKLIPVFRVTRPYLNLLMHSEGEMPFKMHNIIFFPEKKIIINMCGYPT